MKHNRFSRILVVAIIFSLLMIALPATPVQAQILTLTPNLGKIGSHVIIEGEDYSYATAVFVYFSSQQAEVEDEIDDEITIYEEVKRVVTYGQHDLNEAGTFPANTGFDVPSELTDGEDFEVVHGGTYYVYTAYMNNEILTVDDFTVVGISGVTPAEAPVGTRVEIEGVGFEGKKEIVLEYDGIEVDIASGDGRTQTNGAFISRIDIPPSTAGVHTITAKVTDTEGEANFTVVPAITIDPTSGGPNDEVTVTGSGFGDDVELTVEFGGNVMVISGDDYTDENGSFVCSFIVPEVDPGTYCVSVVDDDINRDEAEFSIAAHITLSLGTTADSPGHVGMDLTVDGTGFKASSVVTITYASATQVFTTNSGNDGSFFYTFTVPPSEGGIHIITATDTANNTAHISFYMELTPPSTVYPLLPLADSEVEEWEFDWAGDADDPTIEVTDDSYPITYDFQVAANEDFTSLLLNKTGLPESKYTFLVEEQLEPTDEDEPYYWRARAVDAASNATAWTSAVAFYVGSTFQITGWLLYLLIAIGVILAIFLGIWIGRKLTAEEDYY